MEIQELSIKSESVQAPEYKPLRSEEVKRLVKEFDANKSLETKKNEEVVFTVSDSDGEQVNAEVSEESKPTVKEAVVEEAKPVVEEPKKEVVDDDLSKRFARLSRREKEIQDKQKELKIQMDKIAEFDKLKSEVKSNPMKFIDSFGVSIEDLLLSIASEGEPEKELSETDKLKKEIDDIKQAKAREEEEKVKIKEQEVQAVISNHQSNITKFIKDNAEKYELCNAQEASDIVWEVTETHWQETGELLSIERAVSMVEEHFEKEAKKLLALNKFKPKNVEKAKVEEKVQPTVKKDAGPSKTLTNSLSGDVGSKTTNVSKSREQLLEEAFKLFKK